MDKMVFVNLPVTDMQRSIKFYEALGFIKNPEFSDKNGSGMMWGKNIWVMLLTHDFYKQFLKGQTIADTKKTNNSMTAFSMESIAAVKEFAQKAKENGGDFYHVELGMPEDQMYELEVKDPDGNILSAAWMSV
ncbi:VOC family protein [Liquorilactobacillus oeni]|uniref:Glyoxalase family protein n=1 Tax=Liquorilactobacillus oeni DSM 19972 TaxID=1423777 RepID=A0A0R1MM07_9LACO|nr:VOC family protein [Liquorilactobacillus oeni]KRL05635.1 glyoxalase family protein [Liquorilactobacillus oeni DSM 19972]